VGIALFPTLGPAAGSGFVAGSLFIDFDHYLDFLVHNRFRSLSLRQALLYHKYLFPQIKRPEFLSLEIFHTLEFLIGMVGLSLWSGSLHLKAVTGGMALHFLSDLIYLKWIGAFSARSHSFLEYLIRRRRMVRHGIAMERPYQEALERVMNLTS